MPRIRTVKPESWSSPDFCSVDANWRLLFIAMWNWADDYGRGTCEPRELMGFAFPLDEGMTVKEFRGGLEEIRRALDVQFYEVGGRHYYWIPSWDKHQRIEKRAKNSRYPAPDDGTLVSPLDWRPVVLRDGSGSTPVVLPESSGSTPGVLPVGSDGAPVGRVDDDSGDVYASTAPGYPQAVDNSDCGGDAPADDGSPLAKLLKTQVKDSPVVLRDGSGSTPVVLPESSGSTPGALPKNSRLEHRNIGTGEGGLGSSDLLGSAESVDNSPPENLDALAAAHAASMLCDRHRGMNPEDVPPCRACQTRREKSEAESTAAADARRAARRAAIDACEKCDPTGLVLIDGVAHRCDHQPAPDDAPADDAPPPAEEKPPF